MKKQNSMQQKVTEFEYESAHKRGKFFRLQKSLIELEKILEKPENKKKKSKKQK